MSTRPSVNVVFGRFANSKLFLSALGSLFTVFFAILEQGYLCTVTPRTACNHNMQSFNQRE